MGTYGRLHRTAVEISIAWLGCAGDRDRRVVHRDDVQFGDGGAGRVAARGGGGPAVVQPGADSSARRLAWLASGGRSDRRSASESRRFTAATCWPDLKRSMR